MNEKTKTNVIHAFEMFYSLAVLSWFFLPFFNKTPLPIHPLNLSFFFTELFRSQLAGLSFLSFKKDTAVLF
jgi:hypothetical protein